jgi:nascent polypeptide-associated complex subunit alpha
MFPGGMNPKNMGRMMKQMGIKNEEINATKVIIEADGKTIVFDNPQVQIMEVQGQKTYTIMGDTTESTAIPQDDIKMVMESAEVSEEEASKALEEANGDIAQAIMKLKEE